MKTVSRYGILIFSCSLGVWVSAHSTKRNSSIVCVCVCVSTVVGRWNEIELINIELGDYLFIGRPLTLWPLEYGIVSRFAVIAIIIVSVITVMVVVVVVVVTAVDFRGTFSPVYLFSIRKSIAKCHFVKCCMCLCVSVNHRHWLLCRIFFLLHWFISSFSVRVVFHVKIHYHSLARHYENVLNVAATLAYTHPHTHTLWINVLAGVLFLH